MSEQTETTDWANLDEGLDLDEFEAKTGGYVTLGAGIYKVDVTDVKPGKGKQTEKNPTGNNIVFEYTVTEGEFKGATKQEWFQWNDTGKSYLKGRYVSLGCSEEPGTKYSKDDVIGVSAILTLRQNGDYVNVDSVALDAPAAKSEAKASKPKASGGNLFS